MTNRPLPLPEKLRQDRELSAWLNALQVRLLNDGGTLAGHSGASSAHGATGAIVGRGDLASPSQAGVVRQAAANGDVAAASASVGAASAASAPASYSQAHAQSVADLANGAKTAIDQLADEVNTAIAGLNNLQAKLRAAGVLDS